MRHQQKGMYTVEFALVAALFFVLLFGVIEFARALFVWETLTEATRRGARLAGSDRALISMKASPKQPLKARSMRRRACSRSISLTKTSAGKRWRKFTGG